MEKVLVSRFKSRRSTRTALRHLYKSLSPKHLRALNALVNEKDEIFVCAVIAGDAPEHIKVYVETILDLGTIVEMSLDEFIEASLKAQETYIGIASKVFPAVKP